MKNLNIESITVPSNSNLNSRKKIKDQKSRKSIEISKTQKKSAKILSLQKFTHSTYEIPVFDSVSLPIPSSKTMPVVEERKNNDFLLKFKTIAIQLKIRKKPLILDNFHWILYKQWKFTLKKGINQLELKWKKKKTAECLLKSWIRSTILIHAYKTRVLSAIIIQKYWTQVHKTRKFFLSAKTLASILAPYAK